MLFLSFFSQPQSQINKCNNEKRRRELENEYIEQLGEFLQINKRDMTACKPDKAAILSEVVKTVSQPILRPYIKYNEKPLQLKLHSFSRFVSS
jgi:Helix-loop-helix DNA-binding domain